MGNGSGRYETTPERSMRAYDKLPPVVRRAVADAVFDWATQPLLSRLRRGWSLEDIVEYIARGDQDELDRLRERAERRRSR
jgi:hypothetical protein